MSRISWRGHGLAALIAVIASTFVGDLYTANQIRGRVVCGIIVAIAAAVYGYKKNNEALENGAVEPPHQLLGYRLEYMMLVMILGGVYLFFTN